MDTTSRRNIFSTLTLGTSVAAITTATAVTAKAAPTTQSLTTTINTFTSGAGGGGFLGTLTVNSFTRSTNGVLSAVATLAGDVLNATGGVTGSISQLITVPVQVTGSCQILSLTLGPLHLELLGLVVDLNQVVLTITAVPGNGNLLGNLLCA